jgi:chitin synthase
MIFQNQASVRTALYFNYLLLITAALSLVRFTGCLWFLGKNGILCCFMRR